MENFDELEKAMNVKTEIVKETKSVKVKPVKNGEDDPQKDYEYSRAQLYNLVEKGQEAINGILDVCQDSQHPRAYEVAGQLIKSVADTTDKLIDLQKKMVDLEQPTGNGPKTVNNSVFIGSTADLQKIIKQGNINKK
ncbi:MAG: terminase [Rhodospirillaceae bacterium]|nr:terminase [Rhodospirillaceae bacterium]